MDHFDYPKLFTQNPSDYVFDVDEDFDYPMAMITFKKFYIDTGFFWDRELEDISFLGDGWCEESDGCFSYEGEPPINICDSDELYREEMRRRLLEIGLIDIKEARAERVALTKENE